MPALSFQRRFVAPIESGEKEHTIRAWRTRPFRHGDVLSLYYAMRTKQCRLIMRRKCTKAFPIRIEREGWFRNGPKPGLTPFPRIEIAGVVLTRDEKESLARRDGFASLREMASFWDLSQPFNGQIVHWRFDEISAEVLA